VRKSRDNKARSSLYAALKKVQLVWTSRQPRWGGLQSHPQTGRSHSACVSAPPSALAGNSHGPVPPEAAAWLLPRISPIRKKSSSADPQHAPCRRGKFLVCGCNQGAFCFSIGRIGNHVAAPLGPTIIPAHVFPESENDSSWERLALLSSIPPAVGTFYQVRVCGDEMWGTEAQLPAYGFKGP
jgi:hypothetical protein